MLDSCHKPSARRPVNQTGSKAKDYQYLHKSKSPDLGNYLSVNNPQDQPNIVASQEVCTKDFNWRFQGTPVHLEFSRFSHKRLLVLVKEGTLLTAFPWNKSLISSDFSLSSWFIWLVFSASSYRRDKKRKDEKEHTYVCQIISKQFSKTVFNFALIFE